ncbi:Gar1/Naf1 RNA binding region-domain-containing protein [Achaetomium macrosporum]|uniref:H/ACA ribonucleoprotein complex non-core subunit NAF1 n=1 Tax=Achaetomium macrosporum TaxID=79813 RepID=A0AAN7HE61_9PEZI|nr:Gar1/Naf1 RNA binding region-domain-containing protein [Achaetomium macrosporum]
MAGTPFEIPGLGQAKPNEQLPAENFAPDLLAAAASILGENGLIGCGTNGNAQWEKRRQKENQEKQQKEEAATTTAMTDQAHNVMEVDIGDTSTSSAHPEGKQDIKMQDQTPKSAEAQNADASMKESDSAASRDLTHALEAALESHIAEPAGPTEQQDGATAEQQQDATNTGQEAEHPEWEVDSSPYVSSSESSSSDSSSDEDSEDEGSHPLLSIEETARLLMAADGDGEGDGDGAGKSKGAGAVLRTKNEMPEEVLPKPDVTITPEMKIEPLGTIETILENIVVIKSQTPGEVQVIEVGSVVCKEDRTVIGALSDVWGNVKDPRYTLMLAEENEVKELGLAVGMPIYYSVEHAQYVFTQPLRDAKGTDASNLHDEEVAADEMEFSDDEKEAEYKRQQKMKKRGGKGGRGAREQSIATSHTMSPRPGPGASLNYDDDEDGPYRPLARPPGYGQGGPSSLPNLPPKPETGFSPPRGGRGHGHRGAHRGGRGDFRGRNNRGGHRGGDRRHGSRGSGSGSYPQFGLDGAASPQAPFSTLPPPPPQNPHLPPPPFGTKPPAPAGHWPAPPAPFAPPPVSYPHPPSGRPQFPPAHHQPPAGDFTFNYQAWNQTQGQQYQYPPAAPHHSPPAPHQPAHPTGYAQPLVPPQVPAWPVAGAAPQVPPAAGAYNPAFYGGYQQPQQPQQGQQYWAQQQHGSYGQGPTQ